MLCIALEKTQSGNGIVRSTIGVNTWLEHPPSVSAARPPCCTRCGAASRPTGGVLAVHGHGVRARQVRGPLEVGSEAKVVVIDVRRYRCQECGAVMTVVPREVVARMLFSAPAVALALALYGLLGQSAREVRAAVSPWHEVGTPAGGWKTLRRWIARAPVLWTCIRAAPAAASTRARAERAATTLAGHAGAHTSLVHGAFAGAAHAR